MQLLTVAFQSVALKSPHSYRDLLLLINGKKCIEPHQATIGRRTEGLDAGVTQQNRFIDMMDEAIRENQPPTICSDPYALGGKEVGTHESCYDSKRPTSGSSTQVMDVKRRKNSILCLRFL